MKRQLANNKALIKSSPASRKIVNAPRAELVLGAAGTPKTLLSDVRELILAAREGVARTINAGLVTLYWQIGARIRKDILREKRAEYGEQIVSALGTQLTAEFGKGFGKRSLFRMIRFAEVFPDPYILDFLRLKDTYGEKDIEAAILREMESFILELGVGFAFLERQKRMQIDSRDYYLDLLFYHRKLRRLVAIDLKLDEFDSADKGQMELYLNWLKKHEQGADEASPLGIILYAGKQQEHVELLDMEQSGIHVASYVTKAIPKKQLEQKLHEAVRLARARLEERRISQA